jgi:MFS family permease
VTRVPRPFHFFFLVLPYGASFGFVSVALPYVARERGIGVEAIGTVVAAAFAPHAWKFLWAPIVDTTLTRKAWYLIALGLVALGSFASMAMPITVSSLPALTSVVVASQIGLTLLYMACEGVLGRAVPKERKSTAAAWLQGGTFLGLGVGGGVAIELVSRLPGAVAGGIMALLMLTCALPLLAFDEPAAGERRSVPQALRDLLRDVAALLGSRGGIMALALCLSSVGAGAASNLFGAIADDWHASRAMVEITNGWLGGIVSALGAVSAGWFIRRADRRLAYGLAGALTAASGVAMALAPHVSASYAVFTLLYGAFTGMAYAAFSAFAFETIGTESVATKYNVLTSLLNLSIVFKTRIDGRAHGSGGGGSGVLLVDAAMTAGGIALIAVAAVLTRPARR